jgi:hypothetical protein
MGNETIIHIDHLSLQYLQAQSKLQQNICYKWMGFLQKFHLVIKYNKGRRAFKATHFQDYNFWNSNVHGRLPMMHIESHT